MRFAASEKLEIIRLVMAPPLLEPHCPTMVK